jgi:hypothetical protein
MALPGVRGEGLRWPPAGLWREFVVFFRRPFATLYLFPQVSNEIDESANDLDCRDNDSTYSGHDNVLRQGAVLKHLFEAFDLSEEEFLLILKLAGRHLRLGKIETTSSSRWCGWCWCVRNWCGWTIGHFELLARYSACPLFALARTRIR